MIILPAIDIKDGKCVRLLKGEFSTVHQVAADYMETAKSFAACGAEWIHMVDLDGAKDGKPANNQIFIDVANKTNLKVELGGGIRDISTVGYYIQNGISRIILGSAALKNPELVKESVNKFGDKIAVGIDAKDGKVAAEGWLDTTDVDYFELAKKMEQFGVKHIIFTDISKDGTLEGPNIEQLDNINSHVSCNIIASGGIKDINDIMVLKAMNLYGAICGKSIYKGTLNLSDAIRISGNL